MSGNQPGAGEPDGEAYSVADASGGMIEQDHRKASVFAGNGKAEDGPDGSSLEAQTG